MAPFPYDSPTGPPATVCNDRYPSARVQGIFARKAKATDALHAFIHHSCKKKNLHVVVPNMRTCKDVLFGH